MKKEIKYKKQEKVIIICVNQNDDAEDYNSFKSNINNSNTVFTRKYVEQKQYDPNNEDSDINITIFIIWIILFLFHIFSSKNSITIINITFK